MGRDGILLVAALVWLMMSGCATPRSPDPWEPMNRKVFGFNETVDRYALEPVARGWDFVVPEIAQTGLDNFFRNLGMPVILLNDILQAKPKAAGWDVLRLLYNTTFGLAGFIDIATMVEMPRNDEDFGQTLGYWGMPPGPYLVVPLLGSYTVRDGGGAIVDSFAQPVFWFVPFVASVGLTGTELLNQRAMLLEEIAQSRADAFDFYAFVRNAYLQNRRARVADRKDEPVLDEEEAEDLYFFDDEEGFDDGEDGEVHEDRDPGDYTPPDESGREWDDGRSNGPGPAGGPSDGWTDDPNVSEEKVDDLP